MYFAYQLDVRFCLNWQTLLKDTNKCEQGILSKIIFYCHINQDGNKHLKATSYFSLAVTVISNKLSL